MNIGGTVTIGIHLTGDLQVIENSNPTALKFWGLAALDRQPPSVDYNVWSEEVHVPAFTHTRVGGRTFRNVRPCNAGLFACPARVILHLFQCLVDAETARLLPWRELLERRQELRDNGLGGHE